MNSSYTHASADGRKQRGTQWDAWVWMLAATFSGVLLAIILFRLAATMAYKPITLEGLTPLPKSVQGDVKLSDGRAITQSFRAGARQMSHLGIGIANLREADARGVVTVTLKNASGAQIIKRNLALSTLRADDITIVPARANLVPGAHYILTLRTHGVLPAHALSVFYEGDARGFPEGNAMLLVDGKGSTEHRPLSGNIRFQILRRPTGSVLADAVLHSRAATLLGLLGIVLVLTWMSPLRRRVREILERPLDIPVQRLTRRDMLSAAIVGVALATFVTWPQLTSLQRITTMGDVQRALVYRAIARDTLLKEGKVALWDPYLCGGEPLLANAESAQLDPFFLFVLAFGENLGTRLSVTAALTLGFVGAYAIARRFLGAGRIASLVAGGLFSFSGFQMLAFANGNYAWLPVGWIPWVLFFFLESNRRPKFFVGSSIALAFLFLGGSVHMTVYALLATAFLALILSILFRNSRPVLMLILSFMLFTLLVAVKLFPAVEVQAISADFHRPPGFLPPLNWIPKMFWDRTQLTTPQWTFAETGENYRWIEYGAYVGLGPVLLFLVSLPLLVRQKVPAAMLGAAALLFLMIFGYFPWTVLHRLPLLSEILRNPQRARSVFLLFLGLLVASGITALSRRFLSDRWLKALGTTVLTFAILIDLVMFHAPLFRNLYTFTPPLLSRREEFIRVRDSYTNESAGLYRVGYENYRINQGTTDLCNPYMMKRGVAARGNDSSNPLEPYFGEAALPRGGVAQRVATRPTRIAVEFTTPQEDWLLVNQNFFPGWRTNPRREIANKGGLLASRVLPSDTTMTFTYAPLSFPIGAVVSIGALAGAVRVLRDRKRHGT